MSMKNNNFKGAFFFIAFLLTISQITTSKIKKNLNYKLKARSNLLQRISTCNTDIVNTNISIDSLMVDLNSSLNFKLASKILDSINTKAVRIFSNCLVEFQNKNSFNCSLFVSSYLADMMFLLNSIRIKNIDYSNNFTSL